MSIVVKVMDKVRNASDQRARAARRNARRTAEVEGAEAAAEAERTGTGVHATPADVVQGKEELPAQPDAGAPAQTAIELTAPTTYVSTGHGFAELPAAQGQPRQTASQAPPAPEPPATAAPAVARPVGAPGGTGVRHRTTRVISVDQAYLEAEGLMVPEGMKERFERQYRAIKRPLMLNIDGDTPTVTPDANLIMISSALPDEGKSFTTFNLAMSLATELDRTVLIIDADVAKGRLTRLFGLSGSTGLTDLLGDPNLDLSDVLVRLEGYENMRFLPTGTQRQRVTEYYASRRMRDLVEEIAARYEDRVVLFDSPPLLVTSEAAVLASLVGQMIMVVKANETPQHAVTDALAKLDEHKVIGLVLNKCNVASGNDYYGGY